MSGPNPWVPMKEPVDVKHLGKLAEEANELGAIVARCLIQGIDESEPTTGRLNRHALEDEIADVLANISLVVEHFKLDMDRVEDRVDTKHDFLKEWHGMRA